MKNNIKKIIAAGTVSALLATSAFAAKDIMLISHPAHWAQNVVIELSENSEFRNLLNNKNLNSTITLEDFQKAVKILIDEKYESNADSITERQLPESL
jgi:hypothetical protein